MNIILILSGGLDSAVTLYELRRTYNVVKALTFDYGQRHRREIESAKKIAAGLNIPHQVVDLKNLNVLLAGSSLTSPEIDTPHGHYAADNMKQTIVPNRNAIFLNIAAGYAISQGIHAIGLGVHAGDHFIYPDCRPEFIAAQEKALSLANDCEFKLLAPFLHMSKTEIVAKGNELGVPFKHTWTCYEGGHEPCQKCGSCVERMEAFQKNNLQDPFFAS